jgi:hypothetical protein
LAPGRLAAQVLENPQTAAYQWINETAQRAVQGWHVEKAPEKRSLFEKLIRVELL